MNGKRILALALCLLCILLALPACGGSDKEEEATPAENLPGINPVEWEGVYGEEIAQRGTLTVKATGDQSASFVIDWPNSAASRAYIAMNGVYDPEKAAFVYTDAVWINRDFDADGKETDTTVYTDGAGSFTPGDLRLIWTDDTDPSRGATSFLYAKPLDADSEPELPLILTQGETPTVTVAEPETQTETPVDVTVPEPSPTPAADPSKLPIIKKSPTDETVKVGGSASFVARYENAVWAVWHFVSPDGKTDLTYEEAAKQFPKMEIINGQYSTMKLNNIPAELDGWRVYCRYSNKDGYTDTKSALITVTATGAPAATPTPTPEPTATPEPTSGPLITIPTTPSDPTVSIPTVEPGTETIANPWTDTYSLEDAIAGSGVNFTLPEDAVIPEGLMLKTFRYTDECIEAAYSDYQGNIRMRIRKSNTLSGTELSGDNNSYSDVWNLAVKDTKLQCLGNGVTVNAVHYSKGAENYSIIYDPGYEGSGLTPEQLNAILKSFR